MIRLFVRHLVSDFDEWQKGYRAFGSRREDLGVEEHAYFRGALNPNDVTVWHDFADL